MKSTQSLSQYEYCPQMKPWSVIDDIKKQVDKEAQVIYQQEIICPPKYEKPEIKKKSVWWITFFREIRP